MLAEIDQKTKEVLGQLDERLPDLVVGLSERVLGKIELDAPKIEGIVKGMISEFANSEEEKLEVYLCKKDLSCSRQWPISKRNRPKRLENPKASPVLLPGFSTVLMEMTHFLPDIPK